MNIFNKLLSIKINKIFIPAILKNHCSTKTTCKEIKIKIVDQLINYVKVGSGDKPMVCLPGALGTIWSDFKPQISQLNHEIFTIVAFDPPGYGESRPPNRKFTTKFYEHDAVIAHKLMQELGFQKYSVLGWSDGGISGIILASKYQDSVDKLIVWGANSYVTSEDIQAFQKIRDINKWSKKVSQPLINMYGEKEFQDMWNGWCDVQNEFHKKGGNVCMEWVSRVTCPTLILHGAEDPMVGCEHPKYLAANIRNSSMYIFPKGKHNIHIRYAEEFNKQITDFLQDKNIPN